MGSARWRSPSALMVFSHTTPITDPARVLNMPPVIYVPVGIHGYIRCPVDAEPPATVVKWNKDGRPLQVEKVGGRCLLGLRRRRILLTIKMLPLGSVPLPVPLLLKKKKSLGKQRATIWQAFGCVPRPQGTPVSAEQLFCPMLL